MTTRGATGLSTLLTVVAVLAIGGFFYWLHVRAQALPEREPIVQEEEEVGPVTLAELRGDPTAFAGRAAALDSAPVATRLGRAAFTLRLDGDGAFPVLLSTDLLSREAVDLYGGDVVTVWGRIFSLNDSIRSAWVSQGAVDEAQEPNIPALPSFLLADSLEIH